MLHHQAAQNAASPDRDHALKEEDHSAVLRQLPEERGHTHLLLPQCTPVVNSSSQHGVSKRSNNSSRCVSPLGLVPAGGGAAAEAVEGGTNHLVHLFSPITIDTVGSECFGPQLVSVTEVSPPRGQTNSLQWSVLQYLQKQHLAADEGAVRDASRWLGSSSTTGIVGGGGGGRGAGGAINRGDLLPFSPFQQHINHHVESPSPTPITIPNGQQPLLVDVTNRKYEDGASVSAYTGTPSSQHASPVHHPFRSPHKQQQGAHHPRHPLAHESTTTSTASPPLKRFSSSHNNNNNNQQTTPFKSRSSNNIMNTCGSSTIATRDEYPLMPTTVANLGLGGTVGSISTMMNATAQTISTGTATTSASAVSRNRSPMMGLVERRLAAEASAGGSSGPHTRGITTNKYHSGDGRMLGVGGNSQISRKRSSGAGSSSGNSPSRRSLSPAQQHHAKLGWFSHLHNTPPTGTSSSGEVGRVSSGGPLPPPSSASHPRQNTTSNDATGFTALSTPIGNVMTCTAGLERLVKANKAASLNNAENNSAKTLLTSVNNRRSNSNSSTGGGGGSESVDGGATQILDGNRKAMGFIPTGALPHAVEGVTPSGERVLVATPCALLPYHHNHYFNSPASPPAHTLRNPPPHPLLLAAGSPTVQHQHIIPHHVPASLGEGGSINNAAPAIAYPSNNMIAAGPLVSANNCGGEGRGGSVTSVGKAADTLRRTVAQSRGGSQCGVLEALPSNTSGCEDDECESRQRSNGSRGAQQTIAPPITASETSTAERLVIVEGAGAGIHEQQRQQQFINNNSISAYQQAFPLSNAPINPTILGASIGAPFTSPSPGSSSVAAHGSVTGGSFRSMPFSASPRTDGMNASASSPTRMRPKLQSIVAASRNSGGVGSGTREEGGTPSQQHHQQQHASIANNHFVSQSVSYYYDSPTALLCVLAPPPATMVTSSDGGEGGGGRFGGTSEAREALRGATSSNPKLTSRTPKNASAPPAAVETDQWVSVLGNATKKDMDALLERRVVAATASASAGIAITSSSSSSSANDHNNNNTRRRQNDEGYNSSTMGKIADSSIAETETHQPMDLSLPSIVPTSPQAISSNVPHHLHHHPLATLLAFNTTPFTQRTVGERVLLGNDTNSNVNGTDTARNGKAHPAHCVDTSFSHAINHATSTSYSNGVSGGLSPSLETHAIPSPEKRIQTIKGGENSKSISSTAVPPFVLPSSAAACIPSITLAPASAGNAATTATGQQLDPFRGALRRVGYTPKAGGNDVGAEASPRSEKSGNNNMNKPQKSLAQRKALPSANSRQEETPPPPQIISSSNNDAYPLLSIAEGAGEGGLTCIGDGSRSHANDHNNNGNMMLVSLTIPMLKSLTTNGDSYTMTSVSASSASTSAPPPLK